MLAELLKKGRSAHLLALAMLFITVLPGHAKVETVYSGMTADELVAFARNEGWEAERSSALSQDVTIRASGQSIRIEMFDCDERKRCMSGILRDLTYYFLEPDRYGFWHWNLERRGATGFGPSYVTLQRYLHFNGVTDRYLRDVIGKIWPAAAQSFWEEVERRYNAERRADQSVIAPNGAPPEGSVFVGQFTIGGCVYLCETLAMCKDVHINEKNGACWLTLDKQHADFIGLIKTCPRPENRTYGAEISNGIWRLTCANK